MKTMWACLSIAFAVTVFAATPQKPAAKLRAPAPHVYPPQSKTGNQSAAPTAVDLSGDSILARLAGYQREYSRTDARNREKLSLLAEESLLAMLQGMSERKLSQGSWTAKLRRLLDEQREEGLNPPMIEDKLLQLVRAGRYEDARVHILVERFVRETTTASASETPPKSKQEIDLVIQKADDLLGQIATLLDSEHVPTMRVRIREALGHFKSYTDKFDLSTIPDFQK